MASGIAVEHEETQDTRGPADDIRAAVEFRVDVARERDAVRVSPVGEVDLCTIDELSESIRAAMAAGTRLVILDLRATTFLDSTVLHLTVEADEWAAHSGTEFAIIPGPPAVQRTFAVARLSERLPFVDVPRA